MVRLVAIASRMWSSRKQNQLPPISNQLLLMPAHKLSSMIKDGSLSSVKLCEAFAERIKQVNPLVNAMTQERFKEALNDAQRVDDLLAALRSGKQESEFTADELEMLHSPLLGVPISIKESIMVKGMKNTCGLWDRRDVSATEDAVVLSNAKRWGMIPICTTNVPECTLYWADCQNKVYGRTSNPYDLTRITGASSGGEASLLASAGSVIGIGSDIGGSLRIPAHYCGIFSHKPSPFLVSSEGNYPEVVEHRLRLFTLGPMVRYASDLRPMLKCLLSDKDNAKQDTYYKYQPDEISSLRKTVLQKLDEPADLSQVKFYYFDFNKDSELKGKHSVHVNPEFMEAQQEIIDHFRSKFNCQVEKLNLDRYLKKMLFSFQCMIIGGGVKDRDTSYDENELKKTFGIDNIVLEALKVPLGISKHTKESIMMYLLGSTIPPSREKAFPLCEKFEKFIAELKVDFDKTLGDNGVLLMPTMPTLAYKFNVSLTKSKDLRFTTLFNSLQSTVTCAAIRLDKKHKLPFGFSIAAKAYSDHITLSIAEEIELAFGGWVQPTLASEVTKSTDKVNEMQNSKVDSNASSTNQNVDVTPITA